MFQQVRRYAAFLVGVFAALAFATPAAAISQQGDYHHPHPSTSPTVKISASPTISPSASASASPSTSPAAHSASPAVSQSSAVVSEHLPVTGPSTGLFLVVGFGLIVIGGMVGLLLRRPRRVYKP